MPDIRERLLNFINSDKDAPLLAGISVGFYMILFYYSKNFSLVNSPVQLLYFTAYYILIPMAVLYLVFRIMGATKLKPYRRNFLFTGMIAFFAYYIIQINSLPVSKKLAFAVIVATACLLSLKFSKYYKLLIMLLFLMSVFNLRPLAKTAMAAITSSDEWRQQPDGIEGVVFKERPNVYYIQPDGYTNSSNLKSSVYNFDNSNFEGFLHEKGFKVYEDFRSNYYSTLLSNSSMLSLKHHYLQQDVEQYKTRSIIVGDNPVLTIFKNNKYRTILLTEKPYLIMNRPGMGYDYCNINYSEIPFLKDGWENNWDIIAPLKYQVKQNGLSGNFYFIEKFKPGHIHGRREHSLGVEQEKQEYLQKLREANIWLKEVIAAIETSDPDGIIIIGADHGGFAGYKYTGESTIKTDDPELVRSIFGAMLAIKWNSNRAKEYDGELDTCVNLFRTLFAYLAHDKSYLEHSQEDGSYMRMTEPAGIYKYIDDEGNIVFEKQ